MKRAYRRSSKIDGFSLVELLIVISIIAIMASLAIPLFGEVRTAAIAGREAANLDERNRFVAHVRALGGPTNWDPMTVTNGQSWTFTNFQPPITLTYTDPSD